jgi:transcription initiation factor TFIIB
MGEKAGEPNPRLCIACGKGQIVLDGLLGEYYCGICGLVAEEGVVDFSDVSFLFDEDNLSSQSPTSFTKVNKGLGTLLDAKDAIFSGIDNKNLLREPMENEERNFSKALHYLHIVWDGLSLPGDLRSSSAILYRKCIKRGITNGRKMEVMALATASMMCEEAGITRSTDKLIEAFELKSNEITACTKAIKEGFGVIEKHQQLRTLLSDGLIKVEAAEELKNKASRMMEAVIMNKLYSRKKPEVVVMVVLMPVPMAEGLRLARLGQTDNPTTRRARGLAPQSLASSARRL